MCLRWSFSAAAMTDPILRQNDTESCRFSWFDRIKAPLALAAVLIIAACNGDGGDAIDPPNTDQIPPASAPDHRTVLLDPTHPAWSEPAPDTFEAHLETTRGPFVIEVIREWAPVGADRFYNLIRHGYYDDVRFHRVVPDFITQWGVSGDPEVDAVWYERGMPDDTVVASNVRGTIAYAFTEPRTRATQIYINMVDNSRLDAGSFAPFGRVTRGMGTVVDSIYSGYGEGSGGGVRNGDQSRLVSEGNAHLDANFPELDRLIRATIVTR